MDISTIEDKIRHMNQEELEDLKQNRESSKTMKKIMQSMLSPEDMAMASQMLRNKEIFKSAKKQESQEGP